MPYLRCQSEWTDSEGTSLRCEQSRNPEHTEHNSDRWIWHTSEQDSPQRVAARRRAYNSARAA